MHIEHALGVPIRQISPQNDPLPAHAACHAQRALVKKPPVLPHGKTAWGVVKRVRVVKTREDVVKTKLGMVFCLWGRRYSSSAFQRQHPRAGDRRLRPTRPY